MTQPSAAAIYARISSDTEGTRAGVPRQVEDCRKLAKSLGWTVAGEYVDNDISAYSGKVRPAYQQMLTYLADGTVDGVLVYHLDRLTRRPSSSNSSSKSSTTPESTSRCDSSRETRAWALETA